ncbi:hypothetical protein CP082626L3_0400 [Chlamydia psittaci 08-2626_L3]|nr:hypothetical protein CP082626L3_0400 [Chlamydia psittaci 08-2626_L3]
MQLYRGHSRLYTSTNEIEILLYRNLLFIGDENQFEKVFFQRFSPYICTRLRKREEVMNYP